VVPEEEQEPPIVALADARVEPRAVVVKDVNALVAAAAMLAARTHVRLAEVAVVGPVGE
jgi:hypothetical protein